MINKMHPNILSNFRFRFEKEFGFTSSLSDSQFTSIYDDHHLTYDTNSDEDDAILKAMKDAQV